MLDEKDKRIKELEEQIKKVQAYISEEVHKREEYEEKIKNVEQEFKEYENSDFSKEMKEKKNNINKYWEKRRRINTLKYIILENKRILQEKNKRIEILNAKIEKSNKKEIGNLKDKLISIIEEEL
jgi:predicted RNase H-like nuclease (RuvC/YqgF family)